MSNILTAALLLSAANEFFSQNPNDNEVFVTEDGQPFILENRASIHATQNGLSYKKYVRSFDQEDVEHIDTGTTQVPVEDVQTPKQPDVLESKNPEMRGADKLEAEKAQEEASQKGDKIENDENYESVAAIVAKIPEMDLETLKGYLSKENTSETPRKTLIKALSDEIEKRETPETSN
ncbi:hypothetical protein [Soonwooa sp.]|uniref:hypothetical protein n=1 Tax=Soonwooa sp. TaxID=1938592 RepID=UPI0028A868B1|nr:hypothetical protein [Soonwooa sp.]